MVTLENIKKVYNEPNKFVVFEGLNLKVNESEVVAIIGPSGSGKTTLLNIIGIIDRPDEGNVIILEQNVNKLNDDQKADFRNKNLGFIFQMPHLINELNVFENVIIPSLINYKFANSKVKKRALELLEYMDLLEKKDNYPNEISGGEKRRVEIARALMNNPKVLIADEPTANLDPSLKFSIMELFSKIRSDFKTTIIFSTHDYDILKYADRVYKIENKGLIEANKIV